jgi:alcohol dehydrogenase class IV
VAEGAGAVLDVPSMQVDEAAALLRPAARGRPLVAVGGGRVIDTAKAIAAVEGLPCAAVPTTLSGAELTRVHRLPAGAGRVPLVRPSLVVADPDLMASQPVTSLAASAMNALAHAAEAVWVISSHPVAELAALRAARLIALGLEFEEPDRPSLALGALLAAYAMGSTGYAVHHVVAQSVARLAGAPHAEANAVVLPHATALVAGRAPGPVGRLGVALGAAREDPTLVRDRVAGLAARSGARRLRDLGVDDALFPRIAAAAADRPELRRTPGGPVGEEELLALLRAAH